MEVVVLLDDVPEESLGAGQVTASAEVAAWLERVAKIPERE